jgi:hypothetical protein
VQIAVEILWRTQRRLGKISSDILGSSPTARTYKLPSRTITLIEKLALENGHTRGGVLAACAGLLASDVEEAKK